MARRQLHYGPRDVRKAKLPSAFRAPASGVFRVPHDRFVKWRTNALNKWEVIVYGRISWPDHFPFHSSFDHWSAGVAAAKLAPLR